MGIAPKITTTIVDTNTKTIGLTGDFTRLIRYHSNAQATMKVIAQEDDAAINLDLLIIDNGSERGFASGSNDIYHYTFEKVESDTFTFYATDDRNNEASKTVKVDMVNYVKLTCNMGNRRPDASGNMTLTCSGSCFNGYFDETNSSNFNYLEVTYRYTGSGVDTEKYSSYGSGSMIVSRSGNTYSAYANLSGLDYQATYSFEITAADELETVTSRESGVKSKPIFHWGENDFAFEVPVRFKGDMRLKGDGNFGNYLRFGDGDFCYLAELTDDNLTIKADEIDFDTDKLTLNGKSLAEYGTWTPEFQYDGFSYSTRWGWYCKVGNIVTVGFYVKATTPSGLEGDFVEICGLPYTPAIAAAGGGMLSNALMGDTDKNFQCFVAETDGVITTRAQDCDSTSGKVVSTSAGGFRYPSSKSLTASGTITFMTN